MEQKFNFPTETVDLPSKGKLYSEDSKLKDGKIEMKYMTAKEEDIITNQSYIQEGIVIDKLLQSLIVDKDIDYNQILVGDKNALLVASRILGYGKDYSFTYRGKTYTIDLSQLEEKPLHPEIEKAEKNEFTFITPTTEDTIKYKLLTHGDEIKVEEELKGLQKIGNQQTADITTRLRFMILSVNGQTNTSDIKQFIDNRFLARDSRALRNHIKKIQPDVNLTFTPDGQSQGEAEIPIGVNFLWPDSEV